MKTVPITMGIARTTGNTLSSSGAVSGGDKKKAADADAALRLKIFERDNYTCRCCGFVSQKYQEILFQNGNPADTASGNMVTACIFCHQCFNLDKVGEMRSGVLIWMPEMPQADIHHVARAAYVARISQGPVADAARRVLDIFMQRREEAKKRLGTDDPYILATVLRDYISSNSYEMRLKKLEGIRLFPLDRRIIKEADLEFNQFPQILAFWRSKSGPFGELAPRQWLSIYKKLQKTAA